MKFIIALIFLSAYGQTDSTYDCSEDLSKAYDEYSTGIDFENSGVELWNRLDSIKDNSLCNTLKEVMEKSAKASEKYIISKASFVKALKACPERKNYSQNFVNTIGDRQKANAEMLKRATDDLSKKKCPKA